MVYKVAILGDGGVGKTVILARLQGMEFTGKYMSTLGSSTAELDVPTTIGSVSIDFKDFAGQDRFISIVSQEFNRFNPDLVLVVGDVASKITIKNMQKWIDIANGYPILLVYNKTDIGKASVSKLIPWLRTWPQRHFRRSTVKMQLTTTFLHLNKQ